MKRKLNHGPWPFLVWAVATILTLVTSATYMYRACDQGKVAGDWPDHISLQGRHGRPALLVFIHPQCSCTPATVDEVKALLSQLTRPLDVFFVFLSPGDVDQDWVHSDLWTLAEAIPNTKNLEDVGGKLAKAFGVQTSSHVLYFDESASLKFSGGVTPSRGHRGPSSSREYLRQLLQGTNRSSPAAIRSPVYGCPLFDDEGFDDEGSLSSETSRVVW